MKPKNPWSLPESVESYVKRQLRERDFETSLAELRSVCRDCPARGADDMTDICLACPFDGLAEQAATVVLKSRLEKIKSKGEKRKNVKTTIEGIKK